MSKGINHHKEAWKFFYPMGNGMAMITIDPKTGKDVQWVLHHENLNLKEDDPKRYSEWRVEDLVMIPRSVHNDIHQIGRHHSEKTRKKMSLSAKLRIRTPFSNETKNKIRKAHLGVKTVEGYHFWNNGKEEKLCKECPDAEWSKGRLKR